MAAVVGHWGGLSSRGRNNRGNSFTLMPPHIITSHTHIGLLALCIQPQKHTLISLPPPCNKQRICICRARPRARAFLSQCALGHLLFSSLMLFSLYLNHALASCNCLAQLAPCLAGAKLWSLAVVVVVHLHPPLFLATLSALSLFVPEHR